jgi:hypothetical protein
MPPGRIIPYAVPVVPKPREPILLSSVDLHNSNLARPDGTTEPIWQFVYGSQLYQTLFAVYANFRTAVAPGGGLLVYDVKLKLVNYQGVLNIGFIDEKEPVHRPDLKKVYFGVRGGSPLTEITCPFVNSATPPVPTPLTVRPGTTNAQPLTFCRMLYPLEPFHFPLGVNTRRPYDEEVQAGVPVVSVFDTEFQARSGMDYYNQPDRAGMYNNKGYDLEYIRNGGAPLGSPRCHEGTANLTA